MLGGAFREGLGKTEVAVNSRPGPRIPRPGPVTRGAQAGAGTHVRARQQLLHDVGVEDLAAAGQALLLRLQLLVFLDLEERSLRVTSGSGEPQGTRSGPTSAPRSRLRGASLTSS